MSTRTFLRVYKNWAGITFYTEVHSTNIYPNTFIIFLIIVR